MRRNGLLQIIQAEYAFRTIGSGGPPMVASRSVRKILESLIELLEPSNEDKGKYRESGIPHVHTIFHLY